MSYFQTEKIIGKMRFANRICIHPMEGADSEENGTPSPLTYRRYRRFAESGAGLIWFEAVAVCKEGRSNARQLYLNEANFSAFKALVDEVHRISPDVKLICQVTHSGRFNGNFPPALVCRTPCLDEKYPFNKLFSPVTDDYLDGVPDFYENCVRLVKKAGFDGVDIKICHKYLLSELIGAFTRKGKYGGTYENRTRLIYDIFSRVQKYADENFLIGSRLSVYDGIEYPYGFGVDKNDVTKPDYTEPLRLLRDLEKMGLSIVNVTMGTPYYNPYLNKPHRSEILDGNVAAQLLHSGAAYIKQQCPELAVVSTGSSYLNGSSFKAGNEMLAAGKTDFVGYGRQAIAYPGFVNDILTKETIDEKKSCVACNLCGDLLRAGRPVGCVVRDRGLLEEARKYFYECKEKRK